MYGLQSGVMLSALLSLAFVILLVVLLHLYIRVFLRRHEAGRQLNSRLSLTATTSEFPNAGLDLSVLSKLPIFEYRTAANDCAVCLAPLEEGELARLLPTCRHVFHVECINMWLYSHSSCPICRAEVEASPAFLCSSAENEQLPAQDIGDVDLPEVTAGVEATLWTSKDQESSTSRLNLSLRRMLSRVSSQRSTAADVPSGIEGA